MVWTCRIILHTALNLNLNYFKFVSLRKKSLPIIKFLQFNKSEYIYRNSVSQNHFHDTLFQFKEIIHVHHIPYNLIYLHKFKLCQSFLHISSTKLFCLQKSVFVPKTNNKDQV
jgi:hypothetical protein